MIKICVDVILFSADKAIFIFDDGTRIEKDNLIGIENCNNDSYLDINNCIYKPYDVYNHFGEFTIWDLYEKLENEIVINSSGEIYYTSNKDGRFGYKELDTFNEWLQDDRQVAIKQYFKLNDIEELKNVYRYKVIEFIKTINDRCECCGELIDDEDWDNSYGGLYEPPSCNGYYCKHCDTKIKF